MKRRMAFAVMFFLVMAAAAPAVAREMLLNVKCDATYTIRWDDPGNMNTNFVTRGAIITQGNQLVGPLNFGEGIRLQVKRVPNFVKKGYDAIVVVTETGGSGGYCNLKVYTFCQGKSVFLGGYDNVHQGVVNVRGNKIEKLSGNSQQRNWITYESLKAAYVAAGRR